MDIDFTPAAVFEFLINTVIISGVIVPLLTKNITDSYLRWRKQTIKWWSNLTRPNNQCMHYGPAFIRTTPIRHYIQQCWIKVAFLLALATFTLNYSDIVLTKGLSMNNVLLSKVIPLYFHIIGILGSLIIVDYLIKIQNLSRVISISNE